MSKTSSMVGIDIGKEKLSCVLMGINETMMCRFSVKSSLRGYKDMLARVKAATRGKGKVVFALEKRILWNEGSKC